MGSTHRKLGSLGTTYSPEENTCPLGPLAGAPPPVVPAPEGPWDPGSLSPLPSHSPRIPAFPLQMTGGEFH